MSPQAVAAGYPPIQWFRDIVWPIQPATPPVQGSSVTLAYQVQSAWPFAQRSRQAASPLMERTNTSSAGTTRGSHTIGGRLSARYQTTGGANVSTITQLPHYMPALEAAEAAFDDDDAHRIGWLRIYLYEGGTAGAGTDSIGIGMIPDDGTPNSTSAFFPAAAGGFGVYKAAGANTFRYASYGGGGVLLEAIPLTSAAGEWHTVDFIIRQARRGDASTPWLTVRHNRDELITERPFGAPTLADPRAIRANANSWAVIMGGADAGVPWNFYLAWRWRQGRFHPDGFPVAA